MKITKVKISKVKNNPSNPRILKDDKFVKLVNSIKEFPKMLEIRPIVVNKDMIVLGGNMRLRACKEAGLKEIFIIQADDLTKEQQDEFIIKDNSSFGEWDMDMLANEWDEEKLNDWGLDIEFPEIVDDKKEDIEDNIPEIQDTIIVEKGDIFQLGDHRLMCGDSTNIDDVEKLMNGEKADMVFTDPPYGIDYSGGRTQVVATKTYGKLQNDDLKGDELGNLIRNIYCVNAKEIYICVSPIMIKPFLDNIYNNGFETNAVIVWNKKVPGLGYMKYRRQCEFILYIKNIDFKKGDVSDFDLWEISRDGGTTYVHGTQKPVGVPERAINNSSKKGELILDIFGGSGSTLIASEKTNRKCYMMELDEKYIQVILKRYNTYTEGKKEIKCLNRELDIKSILKS